MKHGSYVAKMLGVTVLLLMLLGTVTTAQTGNLAVGKRTVVSGNEVDWLGPENAVDGSTGTRWSSNKADDAWFYVDLGAVHEIDRVVIRWQTPARSYKLLASQDGVEWRNVIGPDVVIRSQGGDEVLDFEPVEARYVKFQGVQRAPVQGILYGYSFTEFEVYKRTELMSVVEALDKIVVVKRGQTRIELPQVPDGYFVTLFGSDALPVIDTEGRIVSPLVDVTVNLLLRIEEAEGSDAEPVYENVQVTVPGMFAQSDDGNEAPAVIPALREWHGRQGRFELSGSARIVVNPADQATLQRTAEVTQADVNDLVGLELDIVYGEPQPGDLYLSIDRELTRLGEEGYMFDVDAYVSITSSTVNGVFYGTRTALQGLKSSPTGMTLPKGIARDYPKYESRGLMIDVARKFYTIDFLRDYVKLLAWYKMNRFQIHLNDDVDTPFADGTRAAFRLESTTYPGLASANGFYTKDEFRQLQQLGLDYGVSVVPEIDTPGHSRAFTDYDPRLGFDRHLNIERPQTVEFVKSLYDEYLDEDNPTFIGPEVHIGTDEYWGGPEIFRAYTDTLIKHINSKGKHPRLWGSLTQHDGTFPVSTEATVDIWHEPYMGAQHAIDLGYDIVNVHYVMLYIVPRIYRDYLDTQFLYERWEPNNWDTTVLPLGHPNVKGGMVALWNDVSDAKGFSMDDSHESMLPAIQVLSEKMWAGTRDDQMSYTDFLALADLIGEAPNANISHRLDVPHPDGMVMHFTFDDGLTDRSGNGFDGTAQNVTITDGRNGLGVALHGGASYVETPLEALGFGWTLSLWINPDPDNADDAILLESPVGQLKLKQGNTGKLGFIKEHYHSAFDYEVPTGVWTHLRLTGDERGVVLYVNGNEYVERLIPASLDSPMHTLVLPTLRIGSETNAFKGRLDDVVIYNRVVEGGGVVGPR